jgi:hypothetical protein
MRTETRLGLVTLVVLGIAAACGGRAGTEIFGYEGVVADGGAGTAGSGGGILEGGVGGSSGTAGTAGSGTGGDEVDASNDVSEDVTPDVSVDTGPGDAPDDRKDFFDSVVFNCPSCLQDQCGTDINDCYNDPTCWQGIQCAVTDCLAGGGGGAGGSGGGGGQIDFACVLGCFNNDMGSAMTALTMFTCITQSCGEACGLGGFAGGGGAGGGGNIVLPGAGSIDLFKRVEHHTTGRASRYVGSVRIPAPEEVACCYPWLVDVLSGRTPDPLPPSAKAKK